jgi:hypothetical protein
MDRCLNTVELSEEFVWCRIKLNRDYVLRSEKNSCGLSRCTFRMLQEGLELNMKISGDLAKCLPKILRGYLMNRSKSITAVPTCYFR